jgi:hypothetical protein
VLAADAAVRKWECDGRGKRAGHGEELLAELGEPLADDG